MDTPEDYFADIPFAESRWKDVRRLADQATGEGDILVLAVLPDNTTVPVWLETTPVLRDPLVIEDTTYVVSSKRMEPEGDLAHYVVYCEPE